MPEKQDPFVTDDARKLVGVETVRVSDPVSLRHIKTYLAAVDDWNPAYHDQEFAAQTEHEHVIAPALFLTAAARRVQPLSRLLEDGQYDDLMIPGISGVTMLAGWDFEFGAPIQVGDTLTIRESIISIDEKLGKNGKLIVVKKQSTSTNQRGELVANDTFTVVYK